MHWGLILLSPVLLAQARTILDDQRQEVILNDASIPPVCGKCEHNVRAIRTIVRKDTVTYNTTETKCSELVEYSIDENGCEKATVACKGFSFLDIFGYGTGRAGKMSTFLDQDVGTENSPISGSKSFSCLQYGWEYNNIECLVGGDVHNPDSCSSSNEETTTTPNTDATTTSTPQTTTEEDCTTTTANVEQTTSTPVTTADPLTVCGKCDPLTFHRPFESEPELVSTCNMRVDYSTDKHGCQQANVTCMGYGTMKINAYGDGYSAHTVHNNETNTEYNNGTNLFEATVSTVCLEAYHGWVFTSFTCYVTREVENALPCFGEETTTTTSTDTTTTSIPPITTTTEEDCTTTTPSEQLTTGASTIEPSTICGKCDPIQLIREERDFGIPAYILPKEPGMVNTCNMQVEYTTREDGCELAIVSCTGYNRATLTGMKFNSSISKVPSQINQNKKNSNVETDLVVAQLAPACLKDGWELNLMSCQVAKEVENPLLCPDEDNVAKRSPHSVGIDDSINPNVALRNEENHSNSIN